MKTNWFQILLIVLCSSVYGQSSISTAGQSFNAGANLLQFTLGEIIVENNPGGPFITSGIVQPNYIITTIKKEFDKLAVIVSPNPFSDMISLTGFDGIISLNIYDFAGKVLASKQVSSGETTNLSALPDGVYLLEINLAKMKNTYKLIKQQ